MRTATAPIARVPPRRRLLLTAVLGGLVLLDAAYYAFVLSQTPSRAGRPGVSLVSDFWLWSWIDGLSLPVPQSPGAVTVAVVACTAVGFLAYAGVVLLHWDRPSRRAAWLIGGLAGAAFTVSALAFPTTNTDVYDYILFGRVAAVHESDPHVSFPDEFAEDPIYPYSSHQYTGKPDNKLPAWTLLTVGLAEVGGDDPVANVILYRSTLAVVNAATLALIAFIVKRIRPQATVTALAIFGLNPIVAFLGPSKTDSLMAFWLVVGAALLVAGRRRLAAAGLVLSMFVKLITLPLAAIYWLREIRVGRAAGVAADALVAAVVVLLLYAPFSRGLDQLVDHLSLLGGGADNVTGPLRAVCVVVFVLLLAAVGLTRSDDHLSLFRGWAIVGLAFAVLMSRPGLAWYLIVPIAVVAIACDRRTALALVPVTAGSFLLSTWRLQDTPSNDLSAELALALVGGLAAVGLVALVVAWIRSGGVRPQVVQGSKGDDGNGGTVSRVTVARSA